MSHSDNAQDRRDKDARWQRLKRAAQRDLRISRVGDVARRRDCLTDTFAFLKVYFPGIFSQPFTPTRREMVTDIENAAQYGGDQATGAPRGEGKTRSALFVALKLMLKGKLRFPIIISKSGPRASRELRNLKEAIRDAPLLIADFPEVFEPVIEIGGWSSRARQQTAFGERTNLEWGEECIIFPTINTELLRAHGWNQDIESAACSQIFASLGIEGPIRGYSVRNERPDLAILDDIDDRESARSELQTATREKIIEEDIGGLAGPDRTIARVMLCTKINDTCIAASFTDRKKKPSWRGRIYKLLDKLPDRMDLWEEYISDRQGRDDTDPDARKAHQRYLANREVMDAGAIVTNPYRFDVRPLSDGEPGQASALQACFDLIADRGWDHFKTEYQNEPPASEQLVKIGLTKEIIQQRLSGFDRSELPPECEIFIGVDVGKFACHWVAGAFRKTGIGNIIHYGIIEVTGAEISQDKDVVERAILRALLSWKDELTSQPFRDSNGNPIAASQVAIDSGYSPDAVCEFVRLHGEPYRATKGIGATFQHGARSRTRRVGNHWYAQVQADRSWLYSIDADYWKRSVQERFVTEPIDENGRPRPGSLTLFVPAGKRDHHTFAAHILAEEWVTEFIAGKGDKSRWLVHSGNNHFLDATALMLCAAEMGGFGLFANARRSVPPAAERPSMAQLAGRR